MTSNKKVLLLIALLFLYLTLVFLHFRIPITLLVGPLTCYLLFENISGKKLILHLIPFIFFLSYKIFEGAYMPDITQSTSSYMFYNSFAAFISSFSYAIYLIIKFPSLKLTAAKKMFGRQLIFGILVIGILFFFILLYKFGYNIEFIIPPLNILYAINLSVLLLSLVYLYIAKESEASLVDITEIDLLQGDLTSLDLLNPSNKECIQKIEDFFRTSTVYLDPSFCLDDLSLILNLPKHKLSSCFSNHFDMNFYSLVSCYRIQHALLLYKNSPNLSWESIALDCGYFSRTTFNKYFKKNTGLLPSEMTRENVDEYFNKEGLIRIEAYSLS